MNYLWVYTDGWDTWGYHKWTLVKVYGESSEVLGDLYQNSPARQDHYREAPWGTTILGLDEDDNEIPLPDTITNIDDAKAYVLALLRLEGEL